jgi:P4 family phage/plasmid primase-like protien
MNIQTICHKNIPTQKCVKYPQNVINTEIKNIPSQSGIDTVNMNNGYCVEVSTTVICTFVDDTNIFGNKKEITNAGTNNNFIDINQHDKDNSINIVQDNNDSAFFANPIIIRRLLKILDKKRNDDFGEWTRIGIIMFHLTTLYNNIDYFELWKEWSKQSSKYVENCCENYWKTIKVIENGLTVKTLYYYAKNDNPEEYKIIIKSLTKNNYNFINDDKIRELDKLYKKGNVGHIEIYHNEFKNDFIYKDGKTFYKYNDETKLWEQTTFDTMHIHFMKNMQKLIEPLVNYYENMATNSSSPIKYKKIANRIKQTPYFYDASRSRCLMSLVASMFINEDLLHKLDSSKILLPVKNGVINLQTGEFRDRIKEDYFTFELNVEWKGIDHNTSDINNFFNNIMLDNVDMINYLQKLLGYSITGLVNEQKFVILYGSGGNGKSVMQNLLKSLMGSYYRQLTSDVIMETKKATAGSASPHLMELMNARLAFVDESEKGGKLNEGVVKSITGGSAITARPLYCNPVTFEPTFQLFLLTNHKPETNVNDAIERRLVLIPFLAEFRSANKYNQKNSNHRLGDDNIEIELLKKLDQLLVWLVNGSIKYFIEGLGNVPKIVDDATNNFLQENDEIGNFISETCDISDNEFMYHKNLIAKYRENYDNNITSKAFTELMKGKGYVISRKRDGNGFKGLKFK